MASVRLPPGCDGAELERRLWAEHRIEIPAMRPEKDLLRISVAAYTRREDVAARRPPAGAQNFPQPCIRLKPVTGRSSAPLPSAPNVVFTGFQKPTPDS